MSEVINFNTREIKNTIEDTIKQIFDVTEDFRLEDGLDIVDMSRSADSYTCLELYNLATSYTEIKAELEFYKEKHKELIDKYNAKREDNVKLYKKLEHTQWQPIETAPKDGEEILCAYGVDMGLEGIMHTDWQVLSWYKDWHGKNKGAWISAGDPEEWSVPEMWMPIPEFKEE